MPAVTKPAHEKGDFLVDYEDKKFEDVKAKPGEKALVTFHTVAFEGSIGLVNLLQATRLKRKGFETSILLYGPGVTLGVQRGFPKLGDEAFPGHLNFNNQITKFMGEGGKVYACRFASTFSRKGGRKFSRPHSVQVSRMKAPSRRCSRMRSSTSSGLIGTIPGISEGSPWP